MDKECGKSMLSIIIPVYNSERYLEKCINSVLHQTFKNFKLVLVDDASTDKSGKICDRFSELDNRVVVIHHDTNKGLSISREDGMNAVDSEWISFIDNDDFVHPEMYQRLLSNANKGDMICIRGEDRTTDEIDNIKWDIKNPELIILRGRDACNQIYSNSVDFGFIGPVWGKIIKRSLAKAVLKNVAAYKEKLYWTYMEDVLFTPLLFYYAKNVVFDNELLYLHRRIVNNLSSTLIPKEYHYESVEAGDVLLPFFKEKKLTEAYNEYLPGYFMLVMSIWYKVWKNENDASKREHFENRITQLYEKYSDDLKAVHTRGIYQILRKVMVMFFAHHRVLWGKTIGKMYFECGRKISY